VTFYVAPVFSKVNNVDLLKPWQHTPLTVSLLAQIELDKESSTFTSLERLGGR